MKTIQIRYTLGDMVFVLDNKGKIQQDEVQEVQYRKDGTRYIIGTERHKDGEVYSTLDEILNALKEDFLTRNTESK